MTPGDLRDLLGIPFTDEQLAAAAAPLAPGLVVAGAGSGKTSVMAARVVWLVGTGQVAPEQVLGLTFTNKAAAELAGRLRSGLQKAGIASTADDLGEPVVSTYHAFAGRLVTEHGLRLGVEPRSRLLADATRYQLAARVLRRHRGPITHLTSPLNMLVGDLVSLESELSEHLVDPEQLRVWDAEWLEVVEATCADMDGQKGTKGHCDDLRQMAVAARRRRELTSLVLFEHGPCLVGMNRMTTLLEAASRDPLAGGKFPAPSAPTPRNPKETDPSDMPEILPPDERVTVLMAKRRHEEDR